MSLKGKEKKMYLYGSWDVFEGQFFSEWNEQVHVCNPFYPNPQNFIVGGMDWGRSSKPSHLTAFYCGFDVIDKIFWEDTSWDRARTFLEVAGKEKTPAEWSKEIKQKLAEFHLTLDNISSVHADTAMFHPKEDGSISLVEQFIEEDPRWRSILLPSNKDRIGGWEVMHKWLRIAPDGLPYWRVARNCVHTIRTLPELIHDDKKGEDLDTEGEDHPADAQRYEKIHLNWIDGFAGSVITNQLPIQSKSPIIIFVDECEVMMNEEATLTYLDGIDSVEDSIFIGATNYQKKIPDRIINRKSRIKFAYPINSLPPEVYLEYIEKKLPDIKKEDLAEFGYKAEEAGLTIDQLKNSLINYHIDNMTIDNSIKEVTETVEVNPEKD